jgi:hypothetical protein
LAKMDLDTYLKNHPDDASALDTVSCVVWEGEE